jgi:hypothetical protein
MRPAQTQHLCVTLRLPCTLVSDVQATQKAVNYIHQVRPSYVSNTSTVSVTVVSRHASPDQRGNFSDIPTLRAGTHYTARCLEQLEGFTAISSTELSSLRRLQCLSWFSTVLTTVRHLSVPCARLI